MRRARERAATTKQMPVPRVPLPDPTVALLDVDEPELLADDSSSAAALRDWPEIAGDVDEWVREHGGRGDEQDT